MCDRYLLSVDKVVHREIGKTPSGNLVTKASVIIDDSVPGVKVKEFLMTVKEYSESLVVVECGEAAG